jgi:type IV pilus assembly protein PilP
VTETMNRTSKNALWLSLMVVFLLSACSQDPAPAPQPRVQTTKITTAPAPAQQTPGAPGSSESDPTADQTDASPSATDISLTAVSEPADPSPTAQTPMPEDRPPAAVAADNPDLPAVNTPAPADQAASAATPDGQPATTETASDLVQMSLQIAGTYDPTGRFDPFEPLFKESPQTPVTPAKDARKKRAPQTPLEQVALSQLKLSAIIRASSGNRALVEDATGKGYVVGKGTYMGLNSGQVVQIERDRLVVEEEVETVLGELILQTTELKLQKPAGEL